MRRVGLVFMWFIQTCWTQDTENHRGDSYFMVYLHSQTISSKHSHKSRWLCQWVWHSKTSRSYIEAPPTRHPQYIHILNTYPSTHRHILHSLDGNGKHSATLLRCNQQILGTGCVFACTIALHNHHLGVLFGCFWIVLFYEQPSKTQNALVVSSGGGDDPFESVLWLCEQYLRLSELG